MRTSVVVLALLVVGALVPCVLRPAPRRVAAVAQDGVAAPASPSSSGAITLVSGVDGSRAWAPITTCSRCSRTFSAPIYGHVVVDDPETRRVVFRGCIRCLVDALDDYAAITSARASSRRRRQIRRQGSRRRDRLPSRSREFDPAHSWNVYVEAKKAKWVAEAQALPPTVDGAHTRDRPPRRCA